MTSWVLQTDALLRGRPADAAQPYSLRRLLALVVLAGALYGAVMGSYGGLAPDRLLQVAYSAIKAPLLLLATFAISLPSFFVLNTLFGVRDDFGRAVRALAGGQAVLTIVLASLAPYTAFWYVTGVGYQTAILLNGVAFGVASVTAQWRIRQSYRALIARNSRHRLLLRAWLATYVFVGVQMGWILRPFIGAPDMPPQFLREGAWGNAYVVVLRILWSTLFG